MREVTARVKARLRERSQEPRTPDVFHFGNVRVDLRRRILWKDGEESHLTTHEAGTLAYLITHRGRDVSRDELLQEVWGYTAALTTRTVDNQILKLRKKIEDTPGQPRHILTVHMQAYAAASYVKKMGIPKTTEELGKHRLVVYGEDERAPVPDTNWHHERWS